MPAVTVATNGMVIATTTTTELYARHRRRAVFASW